MKVREVWAHRIMTASGTVVPLGGSLGGFLCTTAGTLSITEGEAASGAAIVAAFDVAEGSYYPLPFNMPKGAYAVLGGGAEGTFGVHAT